MVLQGYNEFDCVLYLYADLLTGSPELIKQFYSQQLLPSADSMVSAANLNATGGWIYNRPYFHLA